MATENLNIFIRAFNKTSPAFNGIARGLNGIRKKIFSVQAAIGGLAGAAGFGLFVRSTIETNRQFQSLEASLKTFTGSSQAASTAFGVLQEFAAQTPFSLQEVVGGFNRLISVGLNPSITALEAFGNIASGTGKTLEQFVEAAADAAVGEFERLKEFGIKARSEGDKVTFTFKGVETTVKKSAANIQEFLIGIGQTEFGGAIAEQSKTLNGAFSNLNDSVQAFQKKIGEGGLNDALVRLSKRLSQTIGNSDGLAISIGENLGGALNFAIDRVTSIAQKYYALGQVIAELNTGQIGLTETYGRFLDISNQLAEAQIQVQHQLNATKVSVEDLDEKLEEANISIGEQPSRWKDAVDAIKDYTNSIPELEKALGDTIVGGLNKLEDGLMGVFEGTKSVKDAFKDMARSIVQDLIRMQIQKSITGPLGNALSNLFPKAIGGPVQANRGYLVGERGPEMFVPNASGSIIPNKRIAGGGDGVVVNQTINVSTGVSQTVRAEITQLMPQITEASKAAVLDARKRGGSFSRAF